MNDINWLYPTAEARKAHAFLDINSEGSDEIERGTRSLCRKYGRWSSDLGWKTQTGGIPKGACAECARRIEKRKTA